MVAVLQLNSGCRLAAICKRLLSSGGSAPEDLQRLSRCALPLVLGLGSKALAAATFDVQETGGAARDVLAENARKAQLHAMAALLGLPGMGAFDAVLMAPPGQLLGWMAAAVHLVVALHPKWGKGGSFAGKNGGLPVLVMLCAGCARLCAAVLAAVPDPCCPLLGLQAG
jgi:hypothetical protein